MNARIPFPQLPVHCVRINLCIENADQCHFVEINAWALYPAGHSANETCISACWVSHIDCGSVNLILTGSHGRALLQQTTQVETTQVDEAICRRRWCCIGRSDAILHSIVTTMMPASTGLHQLAESNRHSPSTAPPSAGNQRQHRRASLAVVCLCVTFLSVIRSAVDERVKFIAVIWQFARRWYRIWQEGRGISGRRFHS